MTHGVVQNMAAGAEIPGTKINGLMLARKCGTEKSRAVHKKEIAFRRSKCLCSTIAMSLRKQAKRKVVSILKEDHQVLYLFDGNYLKSKQFKYLSKNLSLVISIHEGKLYRPKIKCLFRSYLIELSNAKVSEMIVISIPIVN